MKEIDAPLSKVSEAVLTTAHRFASQCNTSFVGTDHFLLALTYSPGTAARRLLTDVFGLADRDILASTLSEVPFDEEFKKEILQKGLSLSSAPNGELVLSPRMRQVLEHAKELLTGSDRRLLSTDILLQGLCKAPEGVGLKALKKLGIEPDEMWKRAAESKFIDSYVDVSTGSESQLIISLNENKIEVGHYAPLGLYRVPLTSDNFIIFKPGRSTTKGFFTRDQISELEELINNPKVDEHDLQKFFERNPEFLRIHSHSRIYPQIKLETDEEHVLIPDFFLHGATDRLDICDIKLPSVKISAGILNRRRFSAAVFEGVAQLRNYRNYFDDPKRREGFFQKYGLACYKPSLYLVIGRSKDFNSYIERRDCELDFSDVEVLTYDDLLKTAKERTLADLN
jgi:hypothetical protein